jgi:hypothetical protein
LVIVASRTTENTIKMAIGPPDYKSGGRSYHFVSEYDLQQMPSLRKHLEFAGMEFVALHERRPAEIWIEPLVWGSDNR